MDTSLNTITLLDDSGKKVDYVRADSIPSIEKIEGTPVGLYCIVRCRDAGVWAGFVKSTENSNVHLINARRLWSWEAVKGHTLSAVANYGITNNSKIPAATPTVFLTEACELIPTSKESEASIQSISAHNE